MLLALSYLAALPCGESTYFWGEKITNWTTKRGQEAHKITTTYFVVFLCIYAGIRDLISKKKQKKKPDDDANAITFMITFYSQYCGAMIVYTHSVVFEIRARGADYFRLRDCINNFGYGAL